MINIFSIRCGLAFAPYLDECISAFIGEGEFAPRVVRQAGSGLIIRSDDAQMMLRFQNREAALGQQEAKHYSATVRFRREFYDVKRMQDEIVFANVSANLLLSHPQSELWLDAHHVSHLLRFFSGDSTREADSHGLPDWLNISTAAGRLLISDQRSGRWVLLGRDHIEELERRLASLGSAAVSHAPARPPTLTLKGVAIHLQSALKLVEALESFTETGEVTPFAEVTPTYSLIAAKSSEGIELRDSDRRAGLNSREARKYAGIIRAELERLKVEQIERGRTRTVFADDKEGRWVLQWGDEVFVPADFLQRVRWTQEAPAESLNASLVVRQTEVFLILLSPPGGGCVALTESEVKQFHNS